MYFADFCLSISIKCSTTFDRVSFHNPQICIFSIWLILPSYIFCTPFSKHVYKKDLETLSEKNYMGRLPYFQTTGLITWAFMPKIHPERNSFLLKRSQKPCCFTICLTYYSEKNQVSYQTTNNMSTHYDQPVIVNGYFLSRKYIYPLKATKIE